MQNATVTNFLKQVKQLSLVSAYAARLDTYAAREIAGDGSAIDDCADFYATRTGVTIPQLVAITDTLADTTSDGGYLTYLHTGIDTVLEQWEQHCSK